VKTYKVIGNDGQEYGPADLATIRAWVAEGRIAASTRVQAVGTTEWKPASAFPELGAGVPTNPPPPLPQARKSPGSTLTTSPASKPVPSVVFLLVAVPVALVIVAAVMIFIGSNSRNTQTSSPPNAQMSWPAIVPPSPVRSLEDQPYRKAAEQGDAEAQSRLGDLYAKGIGVGRDYGEAAKWYRKAADLGHTRAQYELVRLYAQGLGVARDYSEAAKWCRLAAEKGYIPAQHFLGHLYASGRGLETEYLEAPEPQPTAPERATSAQRNVQSDYAEAAKWWRKAADQGDAAAQSDLGWLYTSGQGVEPNYAEAAAWFRKSAEQGNPNGQHWLGHCYLSGRGVGKDETEAFKCFREAANNGNIAAQGDLGRLYATGRGVEQNSAEAIKWYGKAAEVGLPSAQNDFAWMLATSTNASLRNGLLAVTFAERAVTATRRRDASFLDTLAAAYAEAGDFEKAEAIQNEAITLLKDAASKQDYTARLRLYEAKTPYREAEKE
jgi:TPR repeat protein